MDTQDDFCIHERTMQSNGQFVQFLFYPRRCPRHEFGEVWVGITRFGWGRIRFPQCFRRTPQTITRGPSREKMMMMMMMDARVIVFTACIIIIIMTIVTTIIRTMMPIVMEFHRTGSSRPSSVCLVLERCTAPAWSVNR